MSQQIDPNMSGYMKIMNSGINTPAHTTLRRESLNKASYGKNAASNVIHLGSGRNKTINIKKK